MCRIDDGATCKAPAHHHHLALKVRSSGSVGLPLAMLCSQVVELTMEDGEPRRSSLDGDIFGQWSPSIRPSIHYHPLPSLVPTASYT